MSNDPSKVSLRNQIALAYGCPFPTYEQTAEEISVSEFERRIEAAKKVEDVLIEADLYMHANSIAELRRSAGQILRTNKELHKDNMMLRQAMLLVQDGLSECPPMPILYEQIDAYTKRLLEWDEKRKELITALQTMLTQID